MQDEPRPCPTRSSNASSCLSSCARSARLEEWLHEQWSHRGLFAWALSPLSLLYWGLSSWKTRRTLSQRLPVPVIVVGNIYVGGTGKTPITLELVKGLRERGYTPGIVSRGYGRHEEGATLVTPTSDPGLVGDEPLLIAQSTGAPVAVARQRYQAGLLLLEKHPEVDVILSDDGLQHMALARQCEIAVVGARGIGNGWVLPAGPLREGPARLDSVDAIVLNTSQETSLGTRTPRFVASTCFGDAVNVVTGERVSLDVLEARIKNENLQVLAAAGIASPGRFFAMLRAHDIEAQTMALGDHFDFATNPFKDRDEAIIFITAKDAVKCATHPELKHDARLWVIELETQLEARFFDFIEQKIKR